MKEGNISMGYYDGAVICKNGHVINSYARSYPESNSKYCDKCGEITISTCGNCGADIRGRLQYDGVVDFSDYIEPAYCYACGRPYPWTERRIEALKEVAEMSELLSTVEKEEFNANIKDISVDTPRTKVAAVKVKNLGIKLGKDLWDGVVKPLIVDIASETAKKTMGL